MRIFIQKCSFRTTRIWPFFGFFFSELQIDIVKKRCLKWALFFIRKFREFFGASFEIKKMGSFRLTFFSIFEKLKQNRDFNIIFLYQKLLTT